MPLNIRYIHAHIQRIFLKSTHKILLCQRSLHFHHILLNLFKLFTVFWVFLNLLDIHFKVFNQLIVFLLNIIDHLIDVYSSRWSTSSVKLLLLLALAFFCTWFECVIKALVLVKHRWSNWFLLRRLYQTHIILILAIIFEIHLILIFFFLVLIFVLLLFWLMHLLVMLFHLLFCISVINRQLINILAQLILLLFHLCVYILLKNLLISLVCFILIHSRTIINIDVQGLRLF